jgi:dUTP pyrophosphatase
MLKRPPLKSGHYVNTQVVYVQRFLPGAKLPKFANTVAAGADLFAYIDPDLKQSILINPGERKLIQTGLRVEIPAFHHLEVRPRSGLALRHGITVLNSPGTIDEDYVGDIGVILINHGQTPVVIRHGDRIAQLVISPFKPIKYIEVEEHNETERGKDGFGSTGR